MVQRLKAIDWSWLPQMAIAALIFFVGLYVQSEVAKVKIEAEANLNSREHAAIIARLDRHETRLNEIVRRP